MTYSESNLSKCLQYYMSLLASAIYLHNLFKIFVLWVVKRLYNFNVLGLVWQYLGKKVFVNVAELDIQE